MVQHTQSKFICNTESRLSLLCSIMENTYELTVFKNDYKFLLTFDKSIRYLKTSCQMFTRRSKWNGNRIGQRLYKVWCFVATKSPKQFFLPWCPIINVKKVARAAISQEKVDELELNHMSYRGCNVPRALYFRWEVSGVVRRGYGTRSWCDVFTANWEEVNQLIPRGILALLSAGMVVGNFKIPLEITKVLQRWRDNITS